MQTQTKFHHSVTENGNLQVRLVTEYQDDEGNVIDKKYGEPMTPADTADMAGWDDRSKDIVAAIIDLPVQADFGMEKKNKPHPHEITEAGIEEAVSYDRVIDEDGKIAVRRITRIFDDGVEVSKKFHRSWIMPGDNPDGKDVISKAITEKIHTAKVISGYKAKEKLP